MPEIQHQFIGSLSHYLQGFIHPRWCKISAINSMENKFFLEKNMGKKTCFVGPANCPRIYLENIGKYQILRQLWQAGFRVFVC